MEKEQEELWFLMDLGLRTTNEGIWDGMLEPPGGCSLMSTVAAALGNPFLRLAIQ